MITLFGNSLFPTRIVHSALYLGLAAGLLAVASAKPAPDNLANGLGKIVENNLIEKGQITSPPVGQTPNFAAYKAAIAREASTYAARAITDSASGRYLVEIMPNGRVPVAALQTSLQGRFPLLSITNVDTRYVGHGVLEGYISIDDVPAIASTAGVGSVILQLRPIHSVGAVTEFGVHMHRVNRVSTLTTPQHRIITTELECRLV